MSTRDKTDVPPEFLMWLVAGAFFMLGFSVAHLLWVLGLVR